MKKTRSANVFTHVPAPHVKKNSFDLSHEVKMSGKFGILYPCMLTECLPGDRFNANGSEILLRFAPMLAPMMHRATVRIHTFFVPNRIIWDDWEKFITGGQDGTAAPVMPYTTPAYVGSAVASQVAIRPGSLLDYLGFPAYQDSSISGSTTERISTLPLRAYYKVWNDYYRDPTLDTEFTDRKAISGGDNFADYWTAWPKRIGYEKDYFTAALPWPQRGPQVLIPFDTTIPESDIDYKAVAELDPDGPGSGDVNLTTDPGDAPPQLESASNNLKYGVHNIDAIDVVNTSITINDLRRSFALQRWLENNARGGGRYIEQLQAHFAARVSDYRLQRAEYVGGMKQTVRISEVLSTADTANVPVGDMAGHGVASGRGQNWSYTCEEHGWLISILAVSYDTAYSQGLHRHWTRRDKFDFAWPELANLGEQEVLSKEVFFDRAATADSANQGTFGYVPRYAEYKYVPSRIAGDFRTSLEFWHLARKFTSRPSLNSTFTTLYEDTNGGQSTSRRIFAVQDGTDYLWIQLWNGLSVKRALPYFGVPSGLS